MVAGDWASHLIEGKTLVHRRDVDFGVAGGAQGAREQPPVKRVLNGLAGCGKSQFYSCWRY